jgi:hypothetical protein
MRILIYKRTHTGDPHPQHGIFGEADCMGEVRGWRFDAVIGVGGISYEPRVKGIARKLTWVGIGAHKWGDPRKPLVRFVDHFWCPDETGPYLKNIAPNLAKYVFDTNRRCFIHELPDGCLDLKSVKDFAAMDQEIIKILDLAAKAGPSSTTDGTVMRQVAQRARDIGRNGCGAPSISPSAPTASRDLGPRPRSY